MPVLGTSRVLVVALALVGLCVAMLAGPTFTAPAAPAAAAPATTCGTSAGAELCLEVPSEPLTGTRRITATWGGTRSAIVEFTLDDEYLNHEYDSPWTFLWPTRKELDGTYRLAARVRSGGTAGSWVSTAVTLANGNDTSVPRNPRDHAQLFRPQAGGVLAAVGNAGAEKPDEVKLQRYIESTRPAALLYLGEVHEFGTWATRLDHYGSASFDAADGTGSLWGRMAGYTLPTVGNHETEELWAYRDYWHQRPLWSTSVVGGVRIYDLMSECTAHGGCGAGGEQARWLARQLSVNTEACTVAMWHRPLVSVDKKRSGTKMLAAWQLLARQGGDLVVNADTRDMEEVRPMNADLEVGRADSHMVQLVSGAAAARWVSNATGDARVAWRRYEVPGAVFISRRDRTLRWEFRDFEGTVLRTGRVACGAGTTGEPAPTRQLLRNRSVESGGYGYSGRFSARDRVVRSSRSAYDGRYAMRVTNRARRAQAAGLTTRPVAVSATVAGDTYRGSVWVRATRRGQRVGLRLQECRATCRRADTSIVRLRDRRWHKITNSHVARTTDARLRYAVVAKALPRRVAVYADQFSLARRAG